MVHSGKVNTKILCKLTLLAIGISAFSLNANELKYTIGLDSEAVFQNLFSEERNERINYTNYIVQPRLALNFKSKIANFNWSAEHNHVRRDLDTESVTNNYTNYTYRGRIELVKNLLSFNANGAVNYLNANTNSFLVDDFLLNAENLSKTRSNRFAFTFDLPRGDYFGHQSELSYSVTDSEKSEFFNNQLDSDVLSYNTSTFTGDVFERFNALLTSNFTVSDRNERGDYASRQLSLVTSYQLYNQLGVVLTGSHEANQVSSNESTFSELRDFNSAGAGLIWRESINKQVALTWNRANSDAIEQDEDNEGFVGVDIDWLFTPRTRLSAEYKRRFFGESGSFSFQHRIKRFRTQIQYTEEVTSFSRLIANPDNLGVFVCVDGVADLASCFQPSSLNYQLDPNESFVQFSQQNTEINDELILRKGLSWQLGTQQRRTRLSVNGRYSTNEYLESDRLSRTYSLGTSLSFDVGHKTNIKWTMNAAFSDERIEGESGEAEVYSSELSVTRALGRYFDLSLNFDYVDRNTEGLEIRQGVGGIQGNNGITGDLQDRRISLNLKYALSN
jgi:uncharacterized protein (PEP-CTERM system associated)